MNRLDTIANRQRKTLLRDALFAAFVVMAAAIGASSVGSALQASQVAHR
jgi:hypothetical protein